MKYKVEYKTDTGTRSDDEFVGIYNTKEEAIKAKKRYIMEELGTLFQYTEANSDPNYPLSSEQMEEEYQYDVDRLEGCVVIEPIKNLY